MIAKLTDFIADNLIHYYEIETTDISLLPIGADINASVYKVKGRNQKDYFVKIRLGHSLDSAIAVLTILHQAGIKELIMPIQTIHAKAMHSADNYTIIVYPFVDGHDGFSRALSNEQWIILGHALKQVHEVLVPKSLEHSIRRENFSSTERDAVRSVYAHINEAWIGDEVALQLFKFMKKNESIIQRLVDRSEELSQNFHNQSLSSVLCHADLHGGNVLIDRKGALYIVDWDNPIVAPKERDLMFIGGGVGNVWNKPQEEKLFYQGYGQTEIDWSLLAYYRLERIVEDIKEFCEALLKPADEAKKREMYQHFLNMFAPRGVIEIAFATDNNVIQ